MPFPENRKKLHPLGGAALYVVRTFLPGLCFKTNPKAAERSVVLVFMLKKIFFRNFR